MSIQDKSTLAANINRDLADNATQEISPRDVRQNLLDIIDSVHNLTGGSDLTALNFATPDTRNTRAGVGSLSKLHLDGYISIDNTAYGYSSLGNNYISSGNTAIGSFSNSCNLYGSNNTSLGYASLGINVHGHKNVAVGAYTLHGNKHGDFNIAIGHGAGYYIGDTEHYKLYIGSHNVSGEAACDLDLYGSGVPLIYGELDTLRMGIGVNSLHNYGSLQVSGAVSPNLSEAYDLGHDTYRWKSLNQKIHFSGDSIGIGTDSPSGTLGLVTVQGNILPKHSTIYSIGNEDLKWDGYFNDIVVSGIAKINSYTYNEIASCVYECRTLYLAASGLCEGEPGVCGYMTDEEVEGGGFVLRSSGTGYRRDYEFTYKAPNSSLDCLESDTPYSRSSWNSNISLHIASGRHLMTDRVIGHNESLSLTMTSGCAGLYMENLQTGTEANRFTFGMSTVKSAVSSKLTDVNFLDSGNANFLSSLHTVGSGAQVGHKMMSRGNESNSHGFSSLYIDASDVVTTTQGAWLPPNGTATVYSAGGANTIQLGYQKNDRYSLTSHVGSVSRYALTVMKDPTITVSSGQDTSNYNRWQSSPDAGLFGVSNFSSEKLPKTIVNVQATGDFAIRATAPDGYAPKMELLSGPNDVNNWISSGTATDAVRDGASFGGLVMEYLPSGGYRNYWSSGNPTDPASERLYRRRHAIIGLVTGGDVGGSLDLSWDGINDTGYEGSDAITSPASTRWPQPDYRYRSYVSFSESGVGVNNREPHAPLTVDGDVNKDTSVRGGIIAMRVQGSGTAPRLSRDYGKDTYGDIVASGFSIAEQHTFGQASTLWYCDASGNDFELINNPLNPKNTTAFVSNASGNTFLGYNAPQSRSWLSNGHQEHNSAFGFEALSWSQYTKFSTAVGSKALINVGSGTPSTGSGNVGVGYNAGANMTSAINSIAIGANTQAHNYSNSITIGPNITSGNVYATHDYSLLIGGGDNTIMLYGKMGPNDSDKELTIPKSKFTVSSATEGDKLTIKHDQNAFGTDKAATVFNKIDTVSDYPDGGVVFTFTGANSTENTVMSMRHTDAPMSNGNSFVVSSPVRPVVGISGDLDVLGTIHFADGTALSTTSGDIINPGVGISSSLISGVTTFHTNIEELASAESQIPVSDTASYLYLSTSGNVGKINISALAGYVEASGAARILANQNHVFSNTTVINPAINSYAHLIGYKAGNGIIECNNSTFFGPEAGSYSSSSPVSGSYSSVFLGHRAGYDAISADNSVFIGPNAGNDAEDSRMSVFIGNSAGRDAKADYSIAIGDNALESVSGSYNLEIINKQSQKLITGTDSYKFNIGRTIAGNLLSQRVSVGDPTVNPSAVMMVSHNSIIHATSSKIQEWHSDGEMSASVNKFGAFDNVLEGVLTQDLWAPAAPNLPTSGMATIYNNNWTSGINIWVTNRDSSLSGYNGAYMMVIKMNLSEYRPIWMGCQG
jgi:hypothetical protein